MNEDIIQLGGLNSDLAKSAYLAKNAAFPKHPLYQTREDIQTQLEIYAQVQASSGWSDMPESYRKRAVRGELHQTANLPEELRASSVYQAYYFALSPKQRKVARANGNAIYVVWSPGSTLFV